ncbi:hypothetical protein RPC_1005 [Rhodopseudomonas palustris BisB18]|uniref:Integrase catalytic domain-containing protein n=1 Tax=Rhodopseudomonas palustris (strain BisB18) TaxID=316056 RepID=Q21AL1_RHOPB
MMIHGEIFCSLSEARIIIETWRRRYNTPAPSLVLGLEAAGTRSRAMAGFTNRAGFAGHTSLGAKAAHELRRDPGHLIGAG